MGSAATTARSICLASEASASPLSPHCALPHHLEVQLILQHLMGTTSEAAPASIHTFQASFATTGLHNGSGGGCKTLKVDSAELNLPATTL